MTANNSSNGVPRDSARKILPVSILIPLRLLFRTHFPPVTVNNRPLINLYTTQSFLIIVITPQYQVYKSESITVTFLLLRNPDRTKQDRRTAPKK
jgi:hypothetical protein